MLFCVVESPSVRLPRKYFCRVETHLQGHGGIVWMVVRLACEGVVRSHGAWWVDASGLRDKRVCVGALLGVWGSTRLFLLGSHVGWPRWLWLVVCGGCVV